MGIYDRDYYRREGPSYLDVLWPTGTVCKWLIGINVVVFVFQLVTFDQLNIQENGRGLTAWFDLDTVQVMNGQVWRLLTYAFLHDPAVWQHIVFNMLFLWWFGSELEAMYGPREFLAFYLLAALLGGIAFQAWAIATGEFHVCLGASGAVTALLILYALHFPSRLIYVFLILPVPLWLFAIFQVAQDAFVFVSGVRSTTAVVVHLAGAGFAAAYYQQSWRLTRLWSGWQSWRRRRARSHLRLFRPEAEIKETVAVAAPSSPGLD